MTLGFEGLGRMGGNMVTRLLRGGHSVVVHDVDAEAVRAAASHRARGAATLTELVEARDSSFADRLLAALRHKFGGHPVRRG